VCRSDNSSDLPCYTSKLSCKICMSLRARERKAVQIRSNIKAAISQLDRWNSSQEGLRQNRQTANSENGGPRKRLAAARSLACISQGTQSIHDPPCHLCGSLIHLSEECDFIAVEASDKAAFEDPSTGIHRGIVHRVFQQSVDLYQLLYPRFYPGPRNEVCDSSEAYLLPVPLVGPDYQEIGISRAVRLLRSIPTSAHLLTESADRQLAFIDQFVPAFHSAAFPLGYVEFRKKIHDLWLDDPTEE
jgi:hypothetical protein